MSTLFFNYFYGSISTVKNKDRRTNGPGAGKKITTVSLTIETLRDLKSLAGQSSCGPSTYMQAVLIDHANKGIAMAHARKIVRDKSSEDADGRISSPSHQKDQGMKIAAKKIVEKLGHDLGKPGQHTGDVPPIQAPPHSKGSK